MQEKIFNKSNFFPKTLCAAMLLGLINTGLNAQTEFIENAFLIPDFYGTEDSEFADFDRNLYAYTAWEDPFSDPVPANINTPDPSGFSDNTDAFFVQNGESGAIVASSGGIYSFGGPLTIVVFDDPSYDVGQVLYQVGSIGSLPDPESAKLYYRETPGGPIQGPLPYTHIGFLSDTSDGFTQGVMAWEWDLSSVTVAEYYIEFSAAGSSMSYQRALLDTQAGYDPQLDNAVFLTTNGEFQSPGTVTHTLQGGDTQISYSNGDFIELTATANTGWTFVRWAGAIDSTNATILVEITDGNIDAEAVFAPHNYDVWSDDRIVPGFADGNPAINGQPTADPNNNGLNNILEYALGGEPEIFADPDAFPKVGLSEDGNHLTLTYKMQPFASDLDYRVLVTSDMETWNYNGDGLGGPYTSADISTTYNEDGTKTVVVTDLTDLNSLPAGTIRQMRLEVIYTPES